MCASWKTYKNESRPTRADARRRVRARAPARAPPRARSADVVLMLCEYIYILCECIHTIYIYIHIGTRTTGAHKPSP